MHIATLMLLGSGELGKEFTIAAKRLGCRVIACDRYANAPAMQMADACEVFPMLDGEALRAAVEKHRPDLIVPEIEAIHTGDAGRDRERRRRVAPSARAVQLTMNRDGIRELAAEELGLRHLALPLRREPRRGDRRRPRHSAFPAWSSRSCPARARARAPSDRPRIGARLGLCGRQHARRPAAGDRRGVRRLRQ